MFGQETNFVNIDKYIAPLDMKGCICHCKVADTPFHILGDDLCCGFIVVIRLTESTAKAFSINFLIMQ